MTLDEFLAGLAKDDPPERLSVPLRALWIEAQGDWDRAHRLVQDDPSREAAWVHAYLHRKEGDLGNARYWYSRAGRAPASGSLEVEWRDIAEALLASACE